MIDKNNFWSQQNLWYFGDHFQNFRAPFGLIMTISVALSCFERSYGRHDAYATSKACNVLFSDQLSRRLRAAGTTGSSNCIDPGPTATQIVTATSYTKYCYNML